jgi:non-ribosomal peptide synthetase component F
LLRRIETLAGELGVTPYSVLLTTFGELLRGLSNVNEVVVGGTFANRLDEDTEAMVGHMANSTLFRLRGEPGRTIEEMIRAVARTLFAHADHQEVPYRLVAERLDLARRSGVDRFPQAVFVLNSDYDRLPPVAGLDVRVERLSVTGTTRTDLVFVAVAQRTGLRLWAEFSADHLDPGTVRGWLDRYLGLLCAAADNPGLLVRDWVAAPGSFVSP